MSEAEVACECGSENDRKSRLHTSHSSRSGYWNASERWAVAGAGALGGVDELGGDLLSSAGLVTSSEEYYPTVAINALMRTLRDPAMSSHHPQASVPYSLGMFSMHKNGFQGSRDRITSLLPQ